jgi:glycosyltransferase involved in cell wall biosynthesis
MACGTPVLAFRNGSVPEVIDSGITGEVVERVAEAMCKIGSVLALDRGRVRRRFDQRFSAGRMARDYIKIYQRLAGVGAMRSKQPSTSTVGTDTGETAH